MGKLFEVVWFVDDERLDKETREVIADQNFKVETRWLDSGGDPSRKFWWHVTEVTLDHLRPSLKWKREMEELELAKECEAAIRRGLKDSAARHKQEEEKKQMLREALADIAIDFPYLFDYCNL
jgi:hypothetical protein